MRYNCIWNWKSLSHVWLFVTLWTVAYQAYPWNSPGNNTGVGCHFLLQGIFPTQGSNQGLLCFRQILYHQSHQGSYAGKMKVRRRNKAQGTHGVAWNIVVLDFSICLQIHSLLFCALLCAPKTVLVSSFVFCLLTDTSRNSGGEG